MPRTMTAEREADIYKLAQNASWPDTMHILRFALRDAVAELDAERAENKQLQKEFDAALLAVELRLMHLGRSKVD